MRDDDKTPRTPYESAPMQTALGLFIPKESDESSMPVIVSRAPARKKTRKKKKKGLSFIFRKED